MSLELQPLDKSESVVVDRAFALPSLPISPYADSYQKHAKKWPHLADLELREIPDKRVGLLIGNDVPEAHWIFDQRLGGRKQPYAVKTLFGWMLLGPLGSATNKIAAVNCTFRNELPISEQIQMLYNAEFQDTEALKPALSVDDLRAMQMVQTQSNLENGHYIIPLPWRDINKVLPNNRSVAAKPLAFIEKRFARDRQYHRRYTEVVERNIARGYATRVPPQQLAEGFEPRWYIPHHGVINPKKPEKLRVVLYCAAEFDGISLNSQLLQGPNLTEELAIVLTRFRQYPVAVAADVEEMFMQVRVAESDRGALRFLWWPAGDETGDPVEYQINAHPFGAKSSSFCASYALKRTVEDFGSLYDAFVGEVVLRNFYMDDCLVSLGNEKMASRFVKQISSLLRNTGFRLHKWVSNRPEVLSGIPDTEWAHSSKNIKGSADGNERRLGLEWDPVTDVVRMHFRLREAPLTRRGILSSVSSLYDPLGLVAPIILPTKLLLQRVCLSGLGWDDLIPEDCAE
jgi:hypothetical protein